MYMRLVLEFFFCLFETGSQVFPGCSLIYDVVVVEDDLWSSDSPACTTQFPTVLGLSAEPPTSEQILSAELCPCALGDS